VTTEESNFTAIEQSLKKAATALKRAEVPFLLGGSLAAWARGGPQSRKDLDLMVKPEDAERALQVLVEEGMRPERPPEDWLLKAWDDGVLIDLIFYAVGLPIDDAVIERGEEMNVFSIRMRVMSLEDVISSKLLALDEHFLNYESPLRMARSVREQVDWDEVRRRTHKSPYARAFFSLLEELDVLPETSPTEHRARSSIRVVPASGSE
jgi:hypothetical protein